MINVQPARPSSDRDEDRRAAERFDAFWNGAVLDPLFKGVYPAAIAADFAPLVAPGDLATIKQPIDFFGLNYYAPMYVADGAAKPARGVVRRGAGGDALYRLRLADRPERANRRAPLACATVTAIRKST